MSLRLRFLLPLFLSAFMFAVFAPGANAASDEPPKQYIFHMHQHLVRGYEAMISGHDILDLEDWKNLGLERHSLEMLIFNVAPILGGCECEIVYTSYEIDTPHGRSLELVREGVELSHPVAVFSDDSRIKHGVYVSESILNPDDFFVGLYTHEDRRDILSLTDPEDIMDLTYIAGQNWEIDNLVLDSLGVNHVYADNWETLIFMLIDARADVVMQPFFASEDMGFSEVNGTERFLPIPNVKLPFREGRVFVVSRAHPDGKEFINYLNKGIQVLKDRDDFLYTAHQWAGVINERTEDFVIVESGHH